MTQGSVNPYECTLCFLDEFLSPLASHMVLTERLWPHHRQGNQRSPRHIRGLSRSTDKHQVTKTGSRWMTAPRVERWETCVNETAQISKRCQDNASKFYVSLHEHTKALAELAKMPTRSSSMEIAISLCHPVDAGHK